MSCYINVEFSCCSLETELMSNAIPLVSLKTEIGAWGEAIMRFSSAIYVTMILDEIGCQYPPSRMIYLIDNHALFSLLKKRSSTKQADY